MTPGDRSDERERASATGANATLERRAVVGLFAAAIVSVVGATERDESGASAENGDSSATADGADSGDEPDGSEDSDDEDTDDGGTHDENGDVRFDLSPYEIEECGLTCRDVTTTITNEGADEATDVRAIVTVSTDGDVVWETETELGRLDAAESVTRTERVDLDFDDALAVRSNDGQVTVETIVESDQETERIVREETVDV